MKNSTLISVILFGCLATSMICLPGCSQSTSEESKQENSTSANSSGNTNLQFDQTFTYQGVSIKGSSSWQVNPYSKEPKDYEYTLVLDSYNSHIAIFSDLYKQTESLTSAWSNHYTGSTPTETESWSASGVEYHMGTYQRSEGAPYYLMISGYEPSSGKGFLLVAVFSDKAWNEQDASAVFAKVRESLSYNPSETTIDYKAARSTSSSSSSSSTSPSSSSTSSSSSSTSSSNSVTSSKSKSYSAGTYKIGSDMPAGEYKLTATNGSAYWEVTDSSAADASIVGNDNFTNSTYVTVTEGQYLKLNRCTAEPV